MHDNIEESRVERGTVSGRVGRIRMGRRRRRRRTSSKANKKRKKKKNKRRYRKMWLQSC
jgi:hypothetical protein